MEYEALKTREARRLNGSARLAADQPVAIAIRYRGSQASATVTVVSATGITLKHGDAASETADTTVDTNGVVEFATYTTLGDVVDQINLSANWEAEIVDGLRSDAVDSSETLARAETTLSPTNTQVLPLYWDTSAHLSLSYAISARRTNFNRSQKAKQSVFEECRALVNVGSGTLTLFVYDVTRNRDTSTLLGQWTGTDNTELTAQIAAGEGELRSEVGHDLLVRYTMSVDLPDSGAYLDVAGHVLPE